LRKQRIAERDGGSPEKRARAFERVPEKPRSLKKAIGFNLIRSAFFLCAPAWMPAEWLNQGISIA
jgi:hypothetical protein